jgi:hypothetical protein
MKSFIIAALAAVALSACSDAYRYPCQDPANFESPACKPPACEASGTCTKYLIGEPDAE